jgi:hypothetical protein
MSDKRKYRVAGVHPVLGHAPGETFERDLSPEHEALLLTSGAIKRVGVKSAANKTGGSTASTKE